MAQYTKAVLSKKSKSDLTEIAEELDLEIEDMTKAEIITAILEAPEPDEDEEEDDEEDDSEETDDSDEELDDIDEPELPEDDEEEEDEVDDAPVKKTTKKKTTTKTAGKEGDTLAAKQVAALVGTDAKTIRQFFRSAASTTEAVGSGGRYEFLETDVPKIKEEFEKWNSNRGRRAAGGSTSKKSRNAAKVSEEIEEVEEIEELEEGDLDEDLDEDDIELED